MQTVTRRQPNLVIAQGMEGFVSCPEESRLLTGMKIECLFLRRLIFRVRRSLLACPPFGCTHCRVRRLQEKDTFISKQNVKSLVQRLSSVRTAFSFRKATRCEAWKLDIPHGSFEAQALPYFCVAFDLSALLILPSALVPLRNNATPCGMGLKSSSVLHAPSAWRDASF